MAAITSRRLIHNFNELKRLEKNHFVRLGQGETKTVQACGVELDALALHYRKFVGTRRVGLEDRTCREIEDHFSSIAEAMENLLACIQAQPSGMHLIYDTYEHGHAAWSLDGCQRSADANNVIMQLWHDGHAAQWFLPEPPPARAAAESAPDPGAIPGNRQEELVHLANLMRRLSGIYRSLQESQTSLDGNGRLPFDEKDALVFNLAELIRKKARPALHAVGIATSIHEWATGDLSPEPARFQAAYQAWKNRPLQEPRRRA